MNDYLVENVSFKIIYFKDNRVGERLETELFIGGDNIHLEIKFNELFEENSLGQSKKIIKDIIGLYVTNEPVSKLLDCVDISFVEFNEQDFTENFELVLYSNQDVEAGIIFNTFDAIYSDYGLVKGQSYDENHVTLHFATDGNITVMFKDEFDELNDDDGNIRSIFLDYKDEEDFKLGDIYQHATIESENFFRRFSNQYENYLQEKYKLTPEELEEYSI